MRTLVGGPGAGLLPLAIGAALVVLAGWTLAITWRQRVAFGDLRRIGIMIVALAVCTLLLDSPGFVLATAMLMAVLMVAFNERHGVVLAALGIVGAAATYALFFGVLHVQIPGDPGGLWR